MADDGRSYLPEGHDKSDAYVGVSPEYQTYASETDAPLAATEGDAKDAEKKAQEREKELIVTSGDSTPGVSDSDKSQEEEPKPVVRKTTARKTASKEGE